MNKLTYQKYKGLENVITIDLQNDYTVIAITSKDEETNKYNSTLFLKENTIDDWKLIQDAENIEFDGNVRNVNSAILKHVATLLSDGFFDYYINRYEYELKCFDIGNSIIEERDIREED